MTSPAKILVVDDEIAIRLTIEDILSRDGHQVTTAASGQAALQLIEIESFDLALVDLKLGDMDGTNVLASLYQRSPETVVIMLTAYASLETTITALRQGASDYLFKPCSKTELRESVRAGLLKHQQVQRQYNILRRLEQRLANDLEELHTLIAEPLVESKPDESSSPASNQLAEGQARFLQQNGLIVDFFRRVVILDGQLLTLSPTEFSLLAYLAEKAPQVVSPQELVRQVQGYESEQWEASETVRAHIYHIRQKIKKMVGNKHVIQTIRGIGYTVNV